MSSLQGKGDASHSHTPSRATTERKLFKRKAILGLEQVKRRGLVLFGLRRRQSCRHEAAFLTFAVRGRRCVSINAEG